MYIFPKVCDQVPLFTTEAKLQSVNRAEEYIWQIQMQHSLH